MYKLSEMVYKYEWRIRLILIRLKAKYVHLIDKIPNGWSIEQKVMILCVLIK